MNAFAVVPDSSMLPEESAYFASIGKSFPTDMHPHIHGAIGGVGKVELCADQN